MELKNQPHHREVFEDTFSRSCVEFVKEVFAITVNGPDFIEAGLTGVFNVTMEQPGEGIDLTPTLVGDLSNLTLEPEVLNFNSYTEKSKQVKVIVSQSSPETNFVIKWKKKERTEILYYLDVLDTLFKVSAQRISSQTM